MFYSVLSSNTNVITSADAETSFKILQQECRYDNKEKRG